MEEEAQRAPRGFFSWLGLGGAKARQQSPQPPTPLQAQRGMPHGLASLRAGSRPLRPSSRKG